MSKTETYIAMQSESPDAFQDMLKADLKDVGVARFNQDHLRLLNEFLVLQRVMDDFRQNKISESGWKKADEIIIFLFKYAEEHFGAEEEAMKKANYKDYVSHEAMHSQFRRMLVDYKEVVAARDKKIFLASNMICLIGFFNHINNVDVRYSGLI